MRKWNMNEYLGEIKHFGNSAWTQERHLWGKAYGIMRITGEKPIGNLERWVSRNESIFCDYPMGR